MERRKPLKRKGQFKRRRYWQTGEGKQLKRGKGINAVAPRKRGELNLYRKEAKEFLAHYPLCQACPVLVGAEIYPAPAGALCQNPTSEVHHKAGRVGNMLRNQAYWLAVCRDCHNWIHGNGKTAEALGLIIRIRK